MFKNFLDEMFLIFKQSMTGDDGSYSSKKLTMFEYCQLGVFLVVCDTWANSGRINLEVFFIVVGMAIGQAGLSTYQCQLNKKVPNTETTVQNTEVSGGEIEGTKTIITSKTEG